MVVADFADLECEATAKSVTVCARREQYRQSSGLHETLADAADAQNEKCQKIHKNAVETMKSLFTFSKKYGIMDSAS